MTLRPVALVMALTLAATLAAQDRSPFPDESLTFGPSSARFSPDRSFSIRGQDWPEMDGTW
ncbi:MAG TPA: hypothetical protein VMM93_09665, partial [Vicinamibacterales bacterium]|nr:hypothetical protein [Vicinamibacterales bacterium]